MYFVFAHEGQMDCYKQKEKSTDTSEYSYTRSCLDFLNTQVFPNLEKSKAAKMRGNAVAPMREK